MTFGMSGLEARPDRYDDDDPQKKYKFHVRSRLKSIPDRQTKEMKNGLKQARAFARSKGMTLREYLSIPRELREV